MHAVWLVLGATLLFGFALEGLYRGQAAVRGYFRDPGSELVHPNATEPWWSYWVETDGAVNGPSRYDPYRAWWALTEQSRWVNVDSAGRRVTVPLPDPGPVTRRIVLLGGSVMWGYTVPDSLTIPSLLARQLHAAGERHVEVLNLAQPAYNATQGLATLQLALRAGYRPDVVVSLDGNNDVLAALTDGHPGAAFGETDLARRSAVGWRGFWSNVAGLLRYSALMQRLNRFMTPRAAKGTATSVAGCDTTAHYYANLVASAAALGRRFDFQPYFVWQPHWATTRKPLVPWEAAIRSLPGFPEAMRGCTAAVESLMAGTHDSSFVSFTRIFDGEEAAIFLDEFGHMTPAGNQRVAESIAELIRSDAAP